MRLVLDLNKSMSKDGLMPKKVQVTRGGKTFEQTVYVRTETIEGHPHVHIHDESGKRIAQISKQSEDGYRVHGGNGRFYTTEDHAITAAMNSLDDRTSRAQNLAKKNKRAKMSETERADALSKMKRMKSDVTSLAYAIDNMDVGPNTAAKYHQRYEEAVKNYNNFRQELQTKYGMTDAELGDHPKAAQLKKEEPKAEPAQAPAPVKKQADTDDGPSDHTKLRSMQERFWQIESDIDNHEELALSTSDLKVKQEELNELGGKIHALATKAGNKEVVADFKPYAVDNKPNKSEKTAKKTTEHVDNPTSILDHIKNGDKESAIKMAKEAGIEWVEHSNPNINWMRAHVAIKNSINPPKAKDTMLSDKIAEYKANPSDKLKGSIFRLAKELGNGDVMKEYAPESRALNSAKNANGSSLADHIKNSNKSGAMEEAKKLGITWNEHENANVNWMRAAIAIKKHLQSKTDDVSKKSLADLMNLMKSWYKETKIDEEPLNKSGNTGKPNLIPKKVMVTKDGKTFEQTFWIDPNDPNQTPQQSPMSHKDLHAKLHEHIQAGRKDEAMKMAKDNGISWKEHDHGGINWMRANMAIKQHHEAGEGTKPTKGDEPKKGGSIHAQIVAAEQRISGITAQLKSVDKARHKQLVHYMQKQLDEAKSELQELKAKEGSGEPKKDAEPASNHDSDEIKVEETTINGITSQMQALQKIKVKTPQQKQQLDQLQQRLIAANTRLRELKSKQPDSGKSAGEPNKASEGGYDKKDVQEFLKKYPSGTKMMHTVNGKSDEVTIAGENKMGIKVKYSAGAYGTAFPDELKPIKQEQPAGSGDTSKPQQLVSSGDKQAAMAEAKKMGITWQEHEHAGVNWMRAAMAIKKHAGGQSGESKSSGDAGLAEKLEGIGFGKPEVKLAMSAMSSDDPDKKLGEMGFTPQEIKLINNAKAGKYDGKSSGSEPKKNVTIEDILANDDSHNLLDRIEELNGETESKLVGIRSKLIKEMKDKYGYTYDKANSQKAEKPKAESSAIAGDTHLLLDDEKELLTKYASSHSFTYKVSKASSGAAKIDVFNGKKSRVASLQIYSDAVQAKIDATGGEEQYKNLSTALSTISKQNKPAAKEISKDDVLASVTDSKSKEHVKSRMRSVESAIARAKNSSTFSDADMEYNLRNHGLADARKRFEADLRSNMAGARMTEGERDNLGSGPYGMNYKHKALQDWEDQEWEKARQQGFKNIDKLNEEIGAK